MNLDNKLIKSLLIAGMLLISIVGMAELKQTLEVDKRLEYEVYFWAFAVIFWGTLAGVVFTQAYDRWESYRKLKNEHARAELELLKRKMDPHFFFNTLNNLYGLTVEKSEKAPEVILKLSEIMRYVIYESNEERVSLKREVEYLEKYIEIHRIRFHKKVDISFDKQIENEEIHIAPLMLPVLVENAFKHGVEQLSEDAYLKLNLTSDHEILEFTVRNNIKEKKSEGKTGIGLFNLRKRLEHIYPNKHALEIKKNENTFVAQLILKL